MISTTRDNMLCIESGIGLALCGGLTGVACAVVAIAATTHAAVGAEGGECEPQWTPIFADTTGSDARVNTFYVFDDGSENGPALYVGGDFTTIGGIAANGIAKWNGTSWSALGDGVGGSTSIVGVYAITAFDDGSGSGPQLYVGGFFSTAGGIAASYIAKWDGASWSPLGSGTNNTVTSLVVHEDGSGPTLYVAGGFTMAGGKLVNRIATWDGKSWQGLGEHCPGFWPDGCGLSSSIFDLAVFDDGSGGGPALYAGGAFTSAGGVPAYHIAKWDGAAWSSVDAGTNDWVSGLTVFDDGTGPALYAGGRFTTAGGIALNLANHIAKWNGSTWSPLGSGMDDYVQELLTFDDGSGNGASLIVGGDFSTAGGVSANRIAKWNGAS